MIGSAHGLKETFTFTISALPNGSVRLDVRFSKDGDENVTGAGTWPTLQKAQEVAEKIAARQLAGATVDWSGAET